LADDRLADVLRHLSDDERWRAFEQELSGHLVRVYDLKPSCVRLDSTTASSYGAVSEDGLLQLGYSTDHRPDLPQLKVMLATLDPLGMQLPTEVLSGERADDLSDVPAIAQVRACRNTVGLLYVGDGKMDHHGTTGGV
jgi:transposase